MACFNSKILMAFMLIGCIAFVAESFALGTLAGLALDAKLFALKVFALASFKRFLINSKLAFLFGRKKRDTREFEQTEADQELERNLALQTAFQAEKYLILAEALDEDNCVQLSVCMAMANADKGNLTEVEEIFVESFRQENRTLDMDENVLGTSSQVVPHRMLSISPPTSYIQAAALGENYQSDVVCRRAYTACKLTEEDLKKVVEDAKNVL